MRPCVMAGTTSSRDATLRTLLTTRRTILPDIRPRIDLLRNRRATHWPHQAEDRPVEPRAIMLAHNGPCNSRIAIRVAAVEFIAVIQHYRPLKGPGRVRRPFQNLLRPIHAHVVVHPTGVSHLPLGRVPQLV